MPSTANFDPQCYLKRYPDLRDYSTRKAEPGLPYIERLGWMYQSKDGNWYYGRTDGRNLKRLQDNLYWHWINFGQKEGRIPGCDLPGTYYSNEFDAQAYLARYPDVSGISYGNAAFNPYINNPQKHWFEVGQKQGRVPGYEILSSRDFTGEVAPGTSIFQDNVALIDSQKKYLESSKATGDQQSTTQTNQITGNNKLLLLVGIGAGAYFLLKKKKKK